MLLPALSPFEFVVLEQSWPAYSGRAVNSISFTAADTRLRRSGLAEKHRFERALLHMRAASRLVGDVPAFRVKVLAPIAWGQTGTATIEAAANPARWVHEQAALLRGRAQLPSFRRWATGISLAVAASVAGASVLMVQGYVEHDEAFWRSRIINFTQSPIYGSDGTLIGSLDTSHHPDSDWARKYGFVPLQGEIPPVYRKALLHAENRRYFEGGLHNICGLDPWTSFKSFVYTRGRAGGSTITQQVARGLQPEWEVEKNYLQKVLFKFREFGAGCRLHNTLMESGDPDAAVRLYASFAPIWKGAGGSLRGIEAASRVIWGQNPAELSDARQIVLAAAPRMPLMLQTAEDLAIPCSRVYPRKNNPDYSSETAMGHPARSKLCLVLARSQWLAGEVLPPHRVPAALREIEDMRTHGIKPVNSFQPVPAKRLINLVARTAAALPPGMLRLIAAEADEAELEPGTPLTLSLDAIAQHEFAQEMAAALQAVQTKSARALCMPLLKEASPTTASAKRRCGQDIPVGISADVIALKFDGKTGTIKNYYASTPLLLDSLQSMASLDKLPILLAALQSGYTPESVLCPKAARDGTRQLRRATAPVFGYPDCPGGAYAITLREAVARSDNLALYAVATALGETKLRAAVAALGLAPAKEGERLAYSLSFGAYGTSVRSMVGAGQALMAAAYGRRTSGTAPRVLANGSGGTSAVAGAVHTMLPDPSQRDHLRVLLEAPVQHTSGTLHFLAGVADAGKSGTGSSAVKAEGGRNNYSHSKLTLAFKKDSNELLFFLAAAPVPSVPFAAPDIKGSAFASVYRVLTGTSKEKP